MTHTLDLPAELESGLEAKAARLGVPMERYIIGVLRHDVESSNGLARNGANGTTAQPPTLAAWLERLNEAAPIIAAGTLKPIKSDDIARFIHEAREECGAAGIHAE